MAGAPGQAPGFALPDNRGAMVFRSSFRGNLLISFFASYCRPCARELPMLIELEKKYKKRKNISLVLIAVDANDSGGTAKEKAGRFLRNAGIDHDYLIDMYQVVIAKYNPKKELPAAFLVDAAGHIVFSAVGAGEDTVLRLEKAIQSLK
ncbi:MAG: TlpA family protein disulfide reductase [Spirochaetes bacterium]|nr:TlpA family protein disulfide reductase [Spirochaetota bacterium]